MSRRPKNKRTSLKDYILKIQLSDSIKTIQFYGTKEEMKQLVNVEARAYCVRGIEVTKCDDKAKDSDDEYLDLYDIFPQFKKKEGSL